MAKQDFLKRKLTVYGGSAAGALVVALAAAYFASSYNSSVEQQKNDISNQSMGLQSEYQSLVAQQEKAKKSIELYQKLTEGRQGNDFELDRREVSRILAMLVDQFMISKLEVKISPIENHEDPAFTRPTGKIISSTVSLTFSAPSDELVYGFIKRLSGQLNGYVNIKRLKLTRNGDITNQVLYGISRGERPALVNAEIDFDWLGLQRNAPPADGSAPPAEGAPNG
jgi:hypothetical protein